MIQRLPPHIVHQIAAGEVIERPASVLKELVENSLDAQASAVSLEYEDGGLRYLSVEDDGLGIDANDFSLAFEAHATSKISDLDDLERLQSYGFRGEALASIGSVSDLAICSATRGASLGIEGGVAYGVKQEPRPADKRVGTKVVVRGLFERLPARLKFMKTPRGEAQQIVSVFKKYVLAHENIQWTLTDRATRKVLRHSPQTSFERVLTYFDAGDASQWFEVKNEIPGWKLHLIALKPRHRGSVRSQISLFLNKRPIKDSRLEFALKRGFEGFTEFTREISAVVFLEGSPDLFDVNVHPTKSEVRFLQPDVLFSLVSSTVKKYLEKEHHAAGSALQELERFVPSYAPAAESSISASFSFSRSVENVASANSASVISASGEMSMRSVEAPVQQARLFETPVDYEYLSSIDDTYIVTKRKGELFLFDQHALHERILYEKLLKDFSGGKNIPSQRLLFPMPLNWNGADALLEHEETLQKLGFEIRLWGDGKVQLVAAPALLKRGHEEVLQSLCESLSLPLETMARETLATVACHSAVRAHDRLNQAQIEQLLKDFTTEDALGHCPHGRPTFVRFQLKDLEKLFHRVI